MRHIHNSGHRHANGIHTLAPMSSLLSARLHARACDIKAMLHRRKQGLHLFLSVSPGGADPHFQELFW